MKKISIKYFHNYSYLHIIPISIFLFEWALIFYLQDNISYNIRYIRNETLYILLTGIFFVLLGYLLSFFVLGFQNNPKNKTKLTLDFKYSKLNILNWILVLITIVGAYLCIIEIGNLAHDPMIFINNPLKVRMIVTNIDNNINYKPSYFYKIGSYLLNIGLLTTFISSILQTSKKFYLSTITPFLIAILSSLIFFSRYLFITYILFYLISFFIISQLVNDEEKAIVINRLKYTITISFFLIVTVFFLILFARNFFIEKIFDLAKEQFYFYFTGGVVSFDAYVFQVHENYTYGMSILRGLNKWLVLFGIATDNVVTGADHDFIKISPTITLNTYTFAKSMYQDFGVCGVAIISMFWGFISNYTLIKITQQFSLVRLYFGAVLIFSFIMSFFGFYLESISVIMFRWVLVLILSVFVKLFCK
jgi:oligosaccharide repeat unit polymerase